MGKARREPQVRNRLGVILATLAMEGDRINQKDLAAATGIAESTISAYVNNQITRYDARVIARILDYLNIDIADFFEFIPGSTDAEEESQGQRLAVPATVGS